MTRDQAVKELSEMGFNPNEYIITVTDEDQCKVLIKGDSDDEAFLGNTWEEVIEEIASTY